MNYSTIFTNSSVSSEETKLSQYIWIATVVFLIALLNVVCIIVLVKTPQLQKSRFHYLTLCRSIGDFLSMILLVAMLINASLEVFRWHVPYLCKIISSSVYCFILFSLFQTLLICIERYMAVIQSTNQSLRKKLTQKKILPIFLIISLAYKAAINSIYFSESCTDHQNITYVMANQLPILLIFIVIIYLYTVTIVHLRRMLSKVAIGDQTMSETQHLHRLKRLKLNIFTLGLLISVLTVSILPKYIIVFAMPAAANTIGNIFFIFSPLGNPIIYFLRFTEFRKKIKQICCNKCSSDSRNALDDDVFVT